MRATRHQAMSPMMEPSWTLSAGRKPPCKPRRMVSIVTGPGGALNEIAMMAPARMVENMASPVKTETPSQQAGNACWKASGPKSSMRFAANPTLATGEIIVQGLQPRQS